MWSRQITARTTQRLRDITITFACPAYHECPRAEAHLTSNGTSSLCDGMFAKLCKSPTRIFSHCISSRRDLKLNKIGCICLRDLGKISYRLIVFPLPDHIFPLGHVLVHVGREDHPQLPPAHDRVPRARAKWVYVHGRTGALGADQKPPNSSSWIYRRHTG